MAQAFFLKFLLTITILLASQCSAAQQSLSFEKFDYRQGLSHQNVRCVFKDRQGFLWVGTEFGLNRYDGISFKKWFYIPGDTASLPHNLINSISQDMAGYIWVATGNGIARMDMYTGRFTRYGKQYQIPQNIFNYDYNVFVDSSDQVWIGTENGVFVLGSQRQIIKKFPLQLEPKGARLNNFVYDFAEHKDFIYISTSYGLYRIHKKTFVTTHYLLSLKAGDFSNMNALTRLKMGNDGFLWVGTWFKGLAWFDTQNGAFLNTEISIPATPVNTIMDIEIVNDKKNDQLYLATINGLLKLDAATLRKNNNKAAIQFIPDQTNPDAISHWALTGLCKDDYGNLWIGSQMGLNRVSTFPPVFREYSYKQFVQSDFAPVDMVPTSDPAIFWILSGPHNILYNQYTHQFKPHSFNDNRYSQRQLIKAGNGYYCASKYGLLYFDSEGQLKKVYDTSNTTSLTIQHFNRAFADSRGNIWLGSFRKGIVVFSIAHQTFRQYLNHDRSPVPLNGYEIEDFYEDKQGSVWIATGKGAVRYNSKLDKFTLIAPCSEEHSKDCRYVNCFFQTSSGRFLIGTRDGLFEYDYTVDSAKRIPLQGQAISNTIYKITEDRKGRLWLSTKNGLLLFNGDAKQLQLFTQNDGLPDDELYSLLYPISDSVFVVGGVNSLVEFNPLAIETRHTIPPPVITDLTINDRAASLVNPSPVSIAYNQSISFDFISLNYFNSSQNQYQYIVEGLDEQWKNLGNGHSLRFSNLPAGNYILKIKAANSNGEWNKNPLSFSFSVNPPFYKTWWFISLFVVAVAGIAYSIYKYRLQQAIALERLRTRIATDLHDDIGATLSSISFYSEAVKQKTKEKFPEAESILEKMGETSRSMVSNMSDIVWAINPKNDAAESLFKRMHSYAAEICQLKNVQLQFEYDNRIDKRSLSIETRKNIYLIFKEAVNNALKYSECSLLKIKLSSDPQGLGMTINDNGKGFSVENREPGNGLLNIKKRAEELKGNAKITSVENTGTIVELNCPLP